MPNETTAVMTGAQQRSVAAHQPGQDVFKSVLSEDINSKPFAAFPPSVRLAVIVGQPSKAGPYTIRVRVPHGVKLMPHRHPEDRVYTVISGVFYIGLGEQFNPEKLERMVKNLKRTEKVWVRSRIFFAQRLSDISRACTIPVRRIDDHLREALRCFGLACWPTSPDP